MSELIHAPAQLDHDELVAVVLTLLEGVEEGDSLEGFLEYTLADEPDRWDVRARFRVGGATGQGGYQMVGSFVPKS